MGYLLDFFLKYKFLERAHVSISHVNDKIYYGCFHLPYLIVFVL